MNPHTAHILLVAIAAYVAIGGVVALAFVIFGVGRVDPAANGVPWTFRALVLPGVVATWPLWLRRWVNSRGAR
jgi:hypothetical protein